MNITEQLRAAGIENAAQEAVWIEKYGKGDLSKLVRRRCNGEPLQYLLGDWEFYGYPFKVGKGVLIPRPETELLVDLAKEHKPELVADLCAGTGCVGIALARETGCNVWAYEKYTEAVHYLEQNVRLNRVSNKVKIFQQDILKMPFPYLPDCVLINAPYLSREDMRTLQTEVAHEPETALYGGGDDGLDFYREFFGGVRRDVLLNSVLFACEVGDGQAAEVAAMMSRIGLNPQIRKDCNGIDRVVYSVNADSTARCIGRM